MLLLLASDNKEEIDELTQRLTRQQNYMPTVSQSTLLPPMTYRKVYLNTLKQFFTYYINKGDNLKIRHFKKLFLYKELAKELIPLLLSHYLEKGMFDKAHRLYMKQRSYESMPLSLLEGTMKVLSDKRTKVKTVQNAAKFFASDSLIRSKSYQILIDYLILRNNLTEVLKVYNKHRETEKDPTTLLNLFYYACKNDQKDMIQDLAFQIKKREQTSLHSALILDVIINNDEIKYLLVDILPSIKLHYFKHLCIQKNFDTFLEEFNKLWADKLDDYKLLEEKIDDKKIFISLIEFLTSSEYSHELPENVVTKLDKYIRRLSDPLQNLFYIKINKMYNLSNDLKINFPGFR